MNSEFCDVVSWRASLRCSTCPSVGVYCVRACSSLRLLCTYTCTCCTCYCYSLFIHRDFRFLHNMTKSDDCIPIKLILVIVQIVQMIRCWESNWDVESANDIRGVEPYRFEPILAVDEDAQEVISEDHEVFRRSCKNSPDHDPTHAVIPQPACG